MISKKTWIDFVFHIQGSTSAETSIFAYESGKLHGDYFDQTYIPIFFNANLTVMFPEESTRLRAIHTCYKVIFDIYFLLNHIWKHVFESCVLTKDITEKILVIQISDQNRMKSCDPFLIPAVM